MQQDGTQEEEKNSINSLLDHCLVEAKKMFQPVLKSL